MTTTPPGWYPDPDRADATRWWDGAQWAPSEAGTGDDARFQRRDDDASASATDGSTSTDASGDPAGWASPYASQQGDSTTPYASQQGDSSTPYASQQGDSSTPYASQQGDSSTPYASQQHADAWDQGGTPYVSQQGSQDWGQGAIPSWSQPQDASAGAQSYQAPQDWSQQQYDQSQPRKRSTGLVIGLIIGGVVVLGGLVVGAIFLIGNLVGGFANQPSAQQPTQTQPATGGSSFTMDIPAGSQQAAQIEISTSGTYDISVESTNGEDPRISLSGPGGSWEDDDGGDGLDSLISEQLAAGTYTLVVEEYGDDALSVVVTVTQR